MTRNHEKISAKKNSIYAIAIGSWRLRHRPPDQSDFYRCREKSGRLPFIERGILTFIRKKNYVLPDPLYEAQTQNYDC
ncbi:hypothetical protein [Nostoc sp.]|uniref:hypothetical protein n=1 Tax=Nostoc sp. TaxID=1180 RepID=UPI002FF9004E